MLIVYWWRMCLLMKNTVKNIEAFLLAVRAYSLPISINSWIIPFLYGFLNKGNIFYGLIALFGIIVLHMATNIFDDVVDYLREKKAIDSGLKQDFNFQQGKCIYIFNGSFSLKECFVICFFLFFIALLIAIFFLHIYGVQLLYILIPSAILCLLYPILGCFGFGELIVGIIFSPLLYLGVYFVMTGAFSLDILALSISTALLSIAVLHNHMLLDYKYDELNRKVTLCRICKNENNALNLLGLIVIGAYLNIIICIFLKILSAVYLLTLFSLPTAITLYRVMKTHIIDANKIVTPNFFMGNLEGVRKIPEVQRNFMIKFLIVRNLLSIFTLLICISIVISELV